MENWNFEKIKKTLVTKAEKRNLNGHDSYGEIVVSTDDCGADEFVCGMVLSQDTDDNDMCELIVTKSEHILVTIVDWSADCSEDLRHIELDDTTNFNQLYLRRLIKNAGVIENVEIYK